MKNGFFMQTCVGEITKVNPSSDLLFATFSKLYRLVDYFSQFSRNVRCVKMLLRVFSLISVVISCSSACGVPSSDIGLVIKGNDFNRGTWPWIVAVMTRKSGKTSFHCGGVLVSRTKVITAAHCIQDKSRNRLNARDFLLLFGAHDLNSTSESGVYSAAPGKIFIHPDWNPHALNYDADIAALILDDPVPSTKFIKPVCIASSGIDIAEGHVTGWGKSEDETKVHENIPKELKMPIWDNEHCFLESNEFTAISSRRTFCGGSRDGRGVCSGDSGGGLFVKSNGAFYVKGLVSASLVRDGKCDVSNFSIFTDISQFYSWILNPSEQSAQVRQPNPACGIMSSSAGLIQNGIKSTNVQWPWAVIITLSTRNTKVGDETYEDFELGSLISDQHVLGDALFLSKKEDEKRVPVDTGIKTFFGVTNMDDYAHTNSLVLDGAEKVVIHPDLDNIGSLKFANFAIIKLKKKLKFSDFIAPVCISSFHDDPYSLSGQYAYAVGMGYDEGKKSKDRKHVPLRIRDKDICESEYGYSLGTAKDKRDFYFCAGGDGKQNACWSDHPLYMKVDGRWFLHAFIQVIWQVNNSGCDKSRPVLYEIAGQYYHWIQNQIGGF